MMCVLEPEKLVGNCETDCRKGVLVAMGGLDGLYGKEASFEPKLVFDKRARSELYAAAREDDADF